MQLDRATGVQCFAISARAMQIWWPKERPWSYVHWYPVLCSCGCIEGGHRRFQGVVLHCVHRLDVRAKFPRKLLSQDTTYAAYMLFKHRTSYKLKHLTHLELEASVGVAGSESTRRVALRGYVDDRPGYRIGQPSSREYVLPSHAAICPGKGDIVFPRKRDGDDWLEVELGEFHNEKGDDSGEVSMSVVDTVEGRYRGRLVVGSIELRSKQRRPTRF
ncbi:F-box protein PP2-B10-like [Brachypodium distachyon]|uniref:F-box domain-containing protein n=1 Tax=Brachypodium distachyon TaxID=15368 RepID=A0A2K2D571_BRADI|nr:F-box protein PP2-B10-like [Brachypodium distachyon]PNT69423.1 hypothetical protein BRADI_3g55009v3 [Brachypodium distachyon]|eukprot:XP_024317933.1 F-box protein PP2-B10-like [Brachypodium distachyon]